LIYGLLQVQGKVGFTLLDINTNNQWFGAGTV
jgi:hypothetical protein